MSAWPYQTTGISELDVQNEFAVEKVSDDNLVGWPRVAAVAAMVSFSLPTFITGLEVSQGLPGTSAITAFLAGSIIIVVIGSIMGVVGAKTRMSSYLLVRVAFGDAGARLVNLAFAISLLGWFGVNINVFTGAVGQLTQTLFNVEVSEFWLSIFASVCMTVTTLIGFRAINMLSTLLVPVLAVVTFMLGWSALESMSLSEIINVERERTLSTGDGISAIVGAIIIGAIILPDITRFVRHWTGAIYTAVVAYIVVQTVVMFAAAMAGTVSGKTDILEILLDVNLGFGAFAIVIAGSWVLNSLNLYSTVLSTKASFDRLPVRALTLGLGVVGVVVALMNILDSFVTFLFYLSVIFIPVAGVIVVDYLIVQPERYRIDTLADNRGWNVKGLIAWAGGAVFAVLVSEGVIPPVTNIAAIDAVALSALVYLALCWKSRSAAGAGQ